MEYVAHLEQNDTKHDSKCHYHLPSALQFFTCEIFDFFKENKIMIVKPLQKRLILKRIQKAYS
jgi:hypothetical protein